MNNKRIKNLNSLSFSKFGTVLSERPSNADKGSSFVIETALQINISTVNTYDSDILLKPNIGLPILYVSENGIDDFNAYLLDKDVIINKGVYIGIISFSGDCSYKMSPENPNIVSSIEIDPFIPADILPDINISKIITLFYQEKEKGFVFDGEKHDFWELTYVDSGSLITTIEDKTFNLTQGDLIIYPPGRFHSQKSPDNISTCFITISFEMTFLKSDTIVEKPIKISPTQKKIFSLIYEEHKNSLPYSMDLVLSYLKQLIIITFRNVHYEKNIATPQSDIQLKIEDSFVQKVIDLIHSNNKINLSITNIAKELNVSDSYLSRLFKKTTGTTIHNYINDYRLKQSKELLRNSKLNISQISVKLGFSSIHYFSNVFKQKYGVSPSEYSKAIR